MCEIFFQIGIYGSQFRQNPIMNLTEDKCTPDSCSWL